MKVMSASEVSRAFSAVLDDAEHGETIVITRAGRRVATMTATSAATWGSLRAVLADWTPIPDPTLEDDMRAARAAATWTWLQPRATTQTPRYRRSCSPNTSPAFTWPPPTGSAQRERSSSLQALPIETYTQRVAERHAELLAHVHRSGTTRGAHDLIIAATALATGRTVLTTDICAGFDQLPGVSARVLAR